MKALATRSPIVFSFVITLVFIALVVLSAVFANRRPAESQGWYIAATVGRAVSIAVLLALVARLGWLRSAGFTRPGRGVTWLFLLLPLFYAVLVSAYAMTGNLDFRTGDALLTLAAALFIAAAAFMEEIAFRGLIQHAFVRGRGDNGAGLLTSVLLASLFFSLMHLVNLLGGAPVSETLLQCVVALFLGIFLGALVLHGMSIYPATFFHAALNLAGYLNLTANGAEGTWQGWLLLSLLMAPLALIGPALLRYSPPATLSVAPAWETEQ